MKMTLDFNFYLYLKLLNSMDTQNTWKQREASVYLIACKLVIRKKLVIK